MITATISEFLKNHNYPLPKISFKKDFVILSGTQIKRNIKGEIFPTKLERLQKIVLADKILTNLSESFPEKLYLINILDISNFEFSALRCRYILNREGLALLSAFDSPQKYYIVLNGEDHFVIRSVYLWDGWWDSWTSIDTVDSILDNTFSYAYDEKLGYLTSNIYEVGSTLKIFALVHIWATIALDKMDKIFDYFRKKENFKIKGIWFYENNIRSGIMEVIYTAPQPLSEAEAITEFEKEIEKLYTTELENRNVFLKEKYGALLLIKKEARRLRDIEFLSLEEALEFLSLLRVGVEIGMFDKSHLENIDRTIFMLPNEVLGLLKEERSERNEAYYKHRASVIKGNLKLLLEEVIKV